MQGGANASPDYGCGPTNQPAMKPIPRQISPGFPLMSRRGHFFDASLAAYKPGVSPFKQWVRGPLDHPLFVEALALGRIPAQTHRYVAGLGVEFLNDVGKFFDNKDNFSGKGLSHLGAISASMLMAKYALTTPVATKPKRKSK